MESILYRGETLSRWFAHAGLHFSHRLVGFKRSASTICTSGIRSDRVRILICIDRTIFKASMSAVQGIGVGISFGRKRHPGHPTGCIPGKKFFTIQSILEYLRGHGTRESSTAAGGDPSSHRPDRDLQGIPRTFRCGVRGNRLPGGVGQTTFL